MHGRMLRALSCALMLLALACGGDERATDDGSLAEAGARDARDGGVGLDAARSEAGLDAGLDADLALGLSTREVCRRYVFAHCQRLDECIDTNYESCVERWLPRCPDLLFSVDSLRTPSDIARCTARFPAVNCGKQSTVGTDCVMPGKRDAGAPCVFANQCESMVCSTAGSIGVCGVCQATVGLGARCSGGELCAQQLRCINDVCQVPPDGEPRGRVRAGASCNGGRSCVAGYACVTSVSDAGIAGDAYCTALPGAGLRCTRGQCAAGAYCSRADQCQALPAVGQPCASEAINGQLQCAVGSYCSTGMCVARGALGATCPTVPCLEGLACLDKQPSGLGTCMRVREEGESCSGMFERCADGTDCTNGRCTARTSLGLYQAACGP